MWKTIENIFDFYIYSIFIEGEKYLKIQSLIFKIEAIKKVRQFYLIFIGNLLALLVFVISLFAGIIYSIYQFTQFGVVRFDLITQVSVLFILLSLLTLFLLLREQLWLNAFEIDKEIIAKLSPAKTSSDTPKVRFSEEDLNHLVKIFNESLEQKINKLVQDTVLQQEQPDLQSVTAKRFQ
ncbi:MAG: hypothetical protein KDD40_01035 [Bdellovibrionales bacterium]|nr:hypothetical protein [Bdellovibrionales bacterium]